MQSGDEVMKRASLETICEAYWKPVYAWLRARRTIPADAEDLTQSFFARLLAEDWLAEVHELKGRLRSFLLVLLKRHAAGERDHRQAKKRGGGIAFVALDSVEAEQAWERLPSAGASPDVVFARQWALQLLGRVMQSLRDTYQKSGRAELFDELRDYLSGGSTEESYGASAMRLGMTTSAVKAAAFRLRERYRTRLREEVLETLGSPAELEEELRWLSGVFS
jgi:DNA-directed RNA polymerase specialized sigma24 family protein